MLKLDSLRALRVTSCSQGQHLAILPKDPGSEAGITFALIQLKFTIDGEIGCDWFDSKDYKLAAIIFLISAILLGA